MASNELWKMSATAIVKAIRKGDLLPSDAIEASINRIEEVDGEGPCAQTAGAMESRPGL